MYEYCATYDECPINNIEIIGRHVLKKKRKFRKSVIIKMPTDDFYNLEKKLLNYLKKHKEIKFKKLKRFNQPNRYRFESSRIREAVFLDVFF